jgi:hypothetical protein
MDSSRLQAAAASYGETAVDVGSPVHVLFDSSLLVMLASAALHPRLHRSFPLHGSSVTMPAVC